MSELLLEYGINTRWHPIEKMGSVTCLVVQSGSLTGIGSSRIGREIGNAFRILPDEWSEHTPGIVDNYMLKRILT